MGYTPPRKVYNLTFEDPDYNGLLIQARGLTVEEVAQVGRWQQDVEGDEASYTLFASKIVSWNVEDPPGCPVPTTYDGIKSQDEAWALSVLQAWLGAVTGVGAPLGRGSTNGETFPEVSLPMAAL